MYLKSWQIKILSHGHVSNANGPYTVTFPTFLQIVWVSLQQIPIGVWNALVASAATVPMNRANKRRDNFFINIGFVNFCVT